MFNFLNFLIISLIIPYETPVLFSIKGLLKIPLFWFWTKKSYIINCFYDNNIFLDGVGIPLEYYWNTIGIFVKVFIKTARKPLSLQIRGFLAELWCALQPMRFWRMLSYNLQNMSFVNVPSLEGLEFFQQILLISVLEP